MSEQDPTQSVSYVGHAATITREIQFDAGHRVPDHASKCRSPHGHRYRVRCSVAGPIREASGSADDGMVLDFGALKDLMVEKVHDVLDHSFIVYAEDYELLGSFGMYYEREDESGGHYGPGSENNYNWKVVVLPYVPTAENLARWIFEQLEDEFKGYTRLSGVSVWETPNCIATYNGSMMFDAAKIAREVYDHEKEDDETTEGGEAGSEVADHSDGEQVQDAVEAVQDEASAEVRLDRPSPWSSKLFNS